MSHVIFQSTSLLHYSSIGQPGSSLAAPVAGGILALIAVLVAVIIVVFILLRYCMHSRQKPKYICLIMCFSDTRKGLEGNTRSKMEICQ